MRKALIIIVVFVALALGLTALGALLPVAHVAAVRVTLRQSPDSVYHVITDVARFTTWRSGLDSVTVVSAAPVRWREAASWGTIEFERVDAIAPRLVKSQIQGAKEQGFGGTWTWDIVPAAAGGTTVTITENGEVYNPLFRLLSRYVFGHYRGLEQFGKDLAARFGEQATPERVTL